MSKLDFICKALSVGYMAIGAWYLIHDHDFIKANTFLLLATINYLLGMDRGK